MHSKAFLKTGGTIINIRGRSNPRNNYNKSHYISTIMNNRSITTNESSGINMNTSNLNNSKNNNIYYKLKKNYKLKKPYESLNYVPLNTIGTGQSTWYHTKTVSSINKEKKQLLEDADKIMKDRLKMNIGAGGVINDRKKSKILEKSKELCLNNYMITQLKEKRTEINKKEFYIDMALKNSEKQYEIDYRSFIDFVEEIKKKEKKEEEILNKMKTRKDSTEINLNEEINNNKKLEEKCENIIKNIILLKNYGSFIHKVFNTPFIYDELSQYGLKGKKYIYLKDKIISIYDKYNSNRNNDANEQEINSILENDELLIQQYNQYEEKLVKILDEKDILDKEINNLKNKIENESASLNQKLKECETEYEKLKVDKKRILTSMKEYQKNNISEIEEYLHYIMDLGKEVGIETQKNSSNKSNTITEYLYYCKDTINILEKKEILINNYIKEIESIIKYGDENDKNIIEKLLLDRKRLIKKEKQAMLKKQQDEYDQKKNLRALERAKRIVIKGRKVFPDVIPWQYKKQDITKKVDEEEDDDQYLYYSDDGDC
jgi:hypothetical protein